MTDTDNVRGSSDLVPRVEDLTTRWTGVPSERFAFSELPRLYFGASAL